MDTLELLLHPVRLRIVYALSGDRVRTTTELGSLLPDVPKTTVYRHVGLLAEGGVLEVASEQRVRGAVERSYRLRADRETIDPGAAASMSLDDHRRGFAAALAAVHAEFNAYLDAPGADPVTDLVGYRQGVIWLSDSEFAELREKLGSIIARVSGNAPTADRTPRLMSLIQFPTNPTTHTQPGSDT